MKGRRVSKCLGAGFESVEVSERRLTLDASSENASTHQFDVPIHIVIGVRVVDADPNGVLDLREVEVVREIGRRRRIVVRVSDIVHT